MQNGVRWFESIRHRSLGGGEAGGRREAVAAGVIAVHVEVFKVFFLDRVLQRFAEPIAGAFCGVHGEFFPVSVTEFNSGVVEQIFKVFSQDKIQQRFVEQNLETSVLRGSCQCSCSLRRHLEEFHVFSK